MTTAARPPAGADRVRELMRTLGRAARSNGRIPFIDRHGPVDYYHYDFYAQALAKIERGHEQDLSDVREMARHGLIRPERMIELFQAIESALVRYPAIDPGSFRDKVHRAVSEISR